MDNSNPYNILGVKRTDDFVNIKKKYHKLCLKYHPDKNGNKDYKFFQKIQEAYNIIKLKHEFKQKYINNDSETFKNEFTNYFRRKVVSYIEYLNKITSNPLGIIFRENIITKSLSLLNYLFRKNIIQTEVIKIDASYIDLFNKAKLNFVYNNNTLSKELVYPFMYDKRCRVFFYVNITDIHELDIDWNNMNATVKSKYKDRIMMLNDNKSSEIKTIFGNLLVSLS
jgi:hypothetical protein